MAFFQNGERQSLWVDDADNLWNVHEEDAIDSPHGRKIEREMKRAKKRIRDLIESKQFYSEIDDSDFAHLYKRYYDRKYLSQAKKQSDFATYRNQIIVPGISTQELSTVIQISTFTGSEAFLRDSAPSGSPNTRQWFNSDKENPAATSIMDRKNRLAARAGKIYLNKSDSRSEFLISEVVKDYVGIGEAFLNTAWIGEGEIGEARYYFDMANMIAQTFSKRDQRTWNNTRFEYAKFLDDNGWHRTALSIVKDLNSDLFKRGSREEDITGLWTVVIDRLASIFLKNRSFIDAEELYQKGLNHFSENSTEPNIRSTQFLERLAFAQVSQGHLREAYANYMRLLDQQPSARQSIRRNLGFIEQRLERFSEAELHDEHSLEWSGGGADDVLARSELFTCLDKLDAGGEENADFWASGVCYVDVNSALASSPSYKVHFGTEPFSFAMARQLETLLSVCNIPLTDRPSYSVTALVNADPLNCLHIRSVQKDEDKRHQIQDRIHSVCESHLNWVFRIGDILDSTKTWSPYYTVGVRETEGELKASPVKSSMACSAEGAFQFLKLCLYLSTWEEEWQFVLELLDSTLDGWLSYLKRNKHMGNLWVEDEDVGSFSPYDSISEDVSYVHRTYPHYRLSDAILVWLALLYIEKMIGFIEGKFDAEALQNVESIEWKVKNVRDSFETYQDTLSLQKVRSSIIETFRIPKDGLFSSTSALPGSQGPEAQSLIGDQTAKKPDQQIIAFQRTVNLSILEIEPTDFPTIEASTLGFFEGSHDHVEFAWNESLRVQRERNISKFEDPRQIALTMFAARCNCGLASSAGTIEQRSIDMLQRALYDSGSFAQTLVEDAMEPISYLKAFTYETMSLLAGSSFKECREIFLSHGRQEPAQPSPNALAVTMRSSCSTQRALNLSLRMNLKNVDIKFLPAWMYYYPDFIHKEELEMNEEDNRDQLNSVKSLVPAIMEWRDFGKPSTLGNRVIPFQPCVADSGKKQSSDQASAGRVISIDRYNDRGDFLARLCQARSPEDAKERLVELSGQDKESVLNCWLTASEEEKPFFLEYMCRHKSSRSFFGERADWRANVWETEFHLGFHELLGAGVDGGKTTLAETVSEGPQYQSSARQMRSQPVSRDHHEILPVAISFRFIGDLRDQFWTCYFFSSTHDGFIGFVDEHYRLRFYDSVNGDYKFRTIEHKIFAGYSGQRKVLELAYVEKALAEMSRSVDKILTAFEKDLKVTQLQGPANERLGFIHDASSLYLEIEGKLRGVSQQLDNSLRTIEHWEKREEARGIRSRWSPKDEERHGEKLRNLTRKCKVILQQLRVQQSSLQEQVKIADQRHMNLVSYKQLQEARMSNQSAADVRLLTYVTIAFLPLSFSSSLFSMANPPSFRTLYFMVPTAAVALIATILVLANLKLMARHWTSWLEKFSAGTREKMKASDQSLEWKDISRQLEETIQRRPLKIDPNQGLPAESYWWSDALPDGDDNVVKSVVNWLESLPRPIRDCIRKMESAPKGPSENIDPLVEDTATLTGEATGSQHSQHRIPSLSAAMNFFLVDPRTRWRTLSGRKHDERHTVATTNEPV
ncbi:MAG: hypothetical protein Q9191_005448 [Dirinaria sp. TL-2023a]